jgi:hypothetical protein
MSQPTDSATVDEATPELENDANTPRSNSVTDESVRSALAAIGRRKDSPEYLRRLFDGAKAARQKINDEYLRELNAEENK